MGKINDFFHVHHDIFTIFGLRDRSADVLSRFARTINSPALRTEEFLSLVSIDTLFLRNEKLPEVEQVWTFDKRAEYYERAVVAKDHVIAALEFDRNTQADLVKMQRERILNLEDEVRELRNLLHEQKVKVPRHKPTKHPIPKDAFGWEGERPTGFKEDK